MTPTLVIMTGPQGAGNHLFSKALGQNSELYGWQQLQQQYWEGHDKEPYLNWLEQQLGLPVTSDGTVLETILQHDANEKYISAVESHWLDDVAKTASSKWY